MGAMPVPVCVVTRSRFHVKNRVILNRNTQTASVGVVQVLVWKVTGVNNCNPNTFTIDAGIV